MNQSILEAARSILLGEAKVKTISNLKKMMKVGDKVRTVKPSGAGVDFTSKVLTVIQVNVTDFRAEDEKGKTYQVGRFENFIYDDSNTDKAKNLEVGYYIDYDDGRSDTNTENLLVVKIDKGTIYAKARGEDIMVIDVNDKNYKVNLSMQEQTRTQPLERTRETLLGEDREKEMLERSKKTVDRIANEYGFKKIMDKGGEQIWIGGLVTPTMRKVFHINYNPAIVTKGLTDKSSVRSKKDIIGAYPCNVQEFEGMTESPVSPQSFGWCVRDFEWTNM